MGCTQSDQAAAPAPPDARPAEHPALRGAQAPVATPVEAAPATGSSGAPKAPIPVPAHLQPLSRTRPWRSISTVTITPDGQFVVTGGDDGTCRVFQATTGREVRQLEQPFSYINAIAVVPGPDRVVVAGCGERRVITGHDFSSGACVQEIVTGHGGDVTSVAAGAAAVFVSGSEDGTAKVWSLDGGHCLCTLGTPELVGGAEELKEGAAGDGAGPQKEAQHGHAGPVSAVALSASGRLVATGGYDKVAKLWQGDTGALLQNLRGHEAEISSVALFKQVDRHCAVTGSLDRTARIWSARDGRVLHVLRGHEHWVYAVTVARDERSVYTASRDRTIKAWEVRRGAVVRTFAGHRDSVRSVVVSPDGSWIASGSNDCSCKVWAAGSGKNIMTLREES